MNLKGENKKLKRNRVQCHGNSAKVASVNVSVTR